MRKHFLSWTVLIALSAGSAQALGPEWLSTPQPIGTVMDMTAGTGIAISGGGAHWAASWEDLTVLHVAGHTPAGELHVFSPKSATTFRVDNVTRQTGVFVKGAPIAWLGSQGEHLAAIKHDNSAVVLFTRNPGPPSSWTAASLPSTYTSFSGNLVAWVTPSSPAMEHVAATASTGEIVVFERAAGTDLFTEVNVTAQTQATGLRVLAREGGLGGGWGTGGDAGSQVFDQLVVAARDGKVYYLDSSPPFTQQWTAREVPLPAGHKPTTDVAGWLTPISRREYVAVRTESNALLAMRRSDPRDPWETFNLTEIDGEEVSGRPAPYNSDAESWRDGLIAPGKNGQALLFWPSTLSPLWHVLDITELIGAAAPLLSASWNPSVSLLSDAVTGAGPDQHLRLVRDFRPARNLTERVSEPFETLRARSGSRKTLTILWNPETNAGNCGAVPNCKTCDPAQIGTGVGLKFPKQSADDMMARVTAYFRENSGGLLTVDNAATIGWFTSLRHGAHYAEEHGPGKCEDGWSLAGGGDVEKLAEAVRQADAGFDFRRFDTNNDKTLSADELTVIVMIPGATADRGAVRPVVAENNAALVVDGVTIREVIEITVGSSGVPHLGTVARELSRHVLGHVDMSWGSPFPRPASALGALALMDGVEAQGHLDAFIKLKLGWVRPRMIWNPGEYRLNDVETRHSVRVLLHPTRGTGEFFLFENRFRGTTFDKGLPADGLAVYHVLQDPIARQNARPPFYVSAADWGRVGVADWGHRAVRLIPPVSNRGYVSDGGPSVPYNDAQSLWRQDAGYELGPFPSSRGRAWLRWAEGTASTNPGVAIRSISAAGPEMQFTVAMVPTLNPTLCATLGKNCGTINDGLGGQVECGTCTAPYECSDHNVCACTPRSCDGHICGRLDRGCNLGEIDCYGDECHEGSTCYKDPRASWHFCRQIPEPCKCGGKPDNCLPCQEDPLAPPPPMR
jgi:M6 family metalloprotease-like protein